MINLASIAFDLRRDSNDPLFVQLCDQIRQRITTGSLSHNTQLPPSRGLAPGLDDCEVSSQALARGVLVTPLSSYYGAGSAQNGLLLGFCSYTEDETRHNVAVLSEILEASVE